MQCAGLCQLFQTVGARRQPKCATHCFLQLNTTLLLLKLFFCRSDRLTCSTFEHLPSRKCRVEACMYEENERAGWESEVRVEGWGKVVVSNYAQASKQQPDLAWATAPAIKEESLQATLRKSSKVSCTSSLGKTTFHKMLLSGDANITLVTYQCMQKPGFWDALASVHSTTLFISFQPPWCLYFALAIISSL